MKRVGYYHVFPFQDVEQGASIVIWGMGEVGQHYLKQILQTSYCNIEYAVDKDWQTHKNSIIKVMPPYAVRCSLEGVRIVIANGNEKIAGEIRKQMIDWGIAEKCIVWNDIIIGESMVVSDQTTQQAPKVKRVGFYHIFPFHCIKKGETVLLWGMGEVGRHYALQLQKTGYARVEYAVDSNWHSVKDAPVEVKAPGQIAKSKETKVVVANGSGNVADSIRARLREMGVENGRIIWEDIIVENELVVHENAQHKKSGVPYLYGSESEVSQRPSPYKYAFILCTYDVITFAVFDVLILRRLNDRNVFFEMIGKKLGVKDFCKIRREAENDARIFFKNNMGVKEPGLYDVYRIVERKTGVEAKYGYETEIELEMEWCHPNIFFKEVYKALISDGKKVLFLEDTLLNKKALYKILNKCGYYVDVDNIYTSCECYTTKIDGGMFQLIRNVYGDKKYIHVGFSPMVDIKPSRQKGFITQSYPSITNYGNKFRATNMSELVREAYRYIVNNELHQYGSKLSIPYEYGFLYGGILTFGFLNWLKRNLESYSVDKVLFLSSDGEVLKNTYQKILGGEKASYLYWSEFVGLYVLADYKRSQILDKILYEVDWEENKVTVEEYFSYMHFDRLLENNISIPFNIHLEMNKRIANVVGEYLIDNWSAVTKIFESQISATETYVRTVIKESKHIAVVDVNNYGENGVLLAESMLKHWGIDCQVDIFTIGSKEETSAAIHSYCFDRGNNRIFYGRHFYSKGDVIPGYYSLLWSEDRPNVKGFTWDKGKLKFLYDPPKVENYKMASEIQRGIYNFCKKYFTSFYDYDELMNVSGWDAYMPFDFISRNGENMEYYKSFNQLIKSNMSKEWTDLKK